MLVPTLDLAFDPSSLIFVGRLFENRSGDLAINIFLRSMPAIMLSRAPLCVSPLCYYLDYMLLPLQCRE